jgi:hypothetical protein
MSLSRGASTFVPALAVLALAACQPPDREAPAGQDSAMPARAADAGVVEVIARDFSFEAPTELPSGWTTFRLENQGGQEHFMSLTKLPEGKTIDDYAAEVGPAFDLTPYVSGELDRDQFLGRVVGLLPEWFGGAVSAGGAGFVSPGHVSETTVKLQPGTYVMECYVKTPEGQFHTELGMLHPLTVTDETTDAAPPEYDLEMSLTSYEIGVQGALTPGDHTAMIRYVDDPEGFFKHDVHLVRFDGDGTVDDVVPWMDWIDGLRAPAPAEFLGGSEHLPAGNTAYFTFSLAPGSYAWISEGYASRGMVMEFTVE